MTTLTDSSLLRRFSEVRDEAAFRELVQRHLRLVYSAALRQLRGDRQLAEEVSQTVFTLLARKSKSLASHPALAGWLFTATRNCARDAARATERRRKHEQEVFTMQHAVISSDGENTEWRKLSPLIDDLLHKLRASDREIIVLRFLEERSYAEVGQALGLSENGARMRAERAMEKLRVALGRRGVASTAAVLSTAMSSHGAVVPPQLAAQISVNALSAAALGGSTGAFVATGISIMNSTKIVSLVAVIACGVAIYESTRAREARRRVTTTENELAAVRLEMDAVRNELMSSQERAQAADEDMTRLLGAFGQTKQSEQSFESRETGATRLTRAEVENRFKRAQQLAKAAQNGDAMNEYLWCFDQGMVGGFSFMVLRNKLIEAMGELAKSYPPMREAMLARRARAEQTMLVDPKDVDQASEFASLSRALGESHRIIDTYIKLPSGDDRRGTLLNNGAFDQFLDARRYSEIVAERSFPQMSQNFDMMKAALVPEATDEDRRKYREILVHNTAKNIEVLAGAGQLENAKALLSKVLEYDDTSGTKAMLAERLTRAGHPYLAKP